MNTLGKTTAVAGAIVAALGATWVGAGAYGAHVAERELQALTAQASGRDGVRLLNLKHERGLLSSTGTVEVRIEDPCSAAGDAPLALQVAYTMKHLPLPGSLMRLEWSLAPAGADGADFAKAFGANTKLQGEGTVAMNGELSSTLALPELAVNGAESVLIAPSTGRIAWGANTFALDWKTERIVVRGQGEALELQQLALAMDLKNRKLGAGSASLSVGKLSTGLGTAEGLRLASEVVERGDRLDMTFTPSLRSLDVAGQQARDLVFEIGLNGVHAPSIETVGQIFGDTCGLEHATADETAKLRTALRTLMARGFTLGIPRIAGTVGNGSLDGRLQVELKPTAGGDSAPILLARVLRSNGQITLKGDVVSAEHKQMALALGVATEVPGGLQAGYDYADGLLKANGRSFDAGGVQAALAQADQAINAFLSSNEAVALALRPVPQDEAATEPPAGSMAMSPVEAPAPVAAAVGETVR